MRFIVDCLVGDTLGSESVLICVGVIGTSTVVWAGGSVSKKVDSFVGMIVGLFFVVLLFFAWSTLGSDAVEGVDCFSFCVLVFSTLGTVAVKGVDCFRIFFGICSTRLSAVAISKSALWNASPAFNDGI